MVHLPLQTQSELRHKLPGLNQDRGRPGLCQSSKAKPHGRRVCFKHQPGGWSIYHKSYRNRRLHQHRCWAGNEQQPGRFKKLLKWGQNMLESLMTENQSAHKLLGPAIPEAPSLRDRTQSSSEGSASPAEFRSQGGESEIGNEEKGLRDNPEEQRAEDLPDTEGRTAGKAKARPRDRSLSTLSPYDKANNGDETNKSRSSIGREGVVVNAKAKISSSKDQKSYFDKVVQSAAMKERADQEIKRRKMQYYHLSRRSQAISKDWPSADEPTWQQWQDHIYNISLGEGGQNEWKFELDHRVRTMDYEGAEEAQRIADVSDQMLAMCRTYNRAIKEEDYETAARLRDEGGLGLVGWWFASSSGYAGGNRPHLLRVAPAFGRLTFEAITPYELAMDHGLIPGQEGHEGRHPQDAFGELREGTPGEERLTTEPEFRAERGVEGTSSDSDNDDASAEVSHDAAEEHRQWLAKEVECVVGELHYIQEGEAPRCAGYPLPDADPNARLRTQAVVFQKASDGVQVRETREGEDTVYAKLRHLFQNEKGGESDQDAPPQGVYQVSTNENGEPTLIVDILDDSETDSDEDHDEYARDEGTDADSTDDENAVSAVNTSEVAGMTQDSGEIRPNTENFVQNSFTDRELQAESTSGESKQEGGPCRQEEEPHEQDMVTNNRGFDSEETAKRKKEMIDSIEVHHNIDTSTDVPILHLFLTAKKEPLEAYQEARENPENKASMEPEIVEVKPDKDPSSPTEPAHTQNMQDDGDDDIPEALLERAVMAATRQLGIWEEVAPAEAQRVPADITRFPGDNDRFLISVFPEHWDPNEVQKPAGTQPLDQFMESFGRLNASSSPKAQGPEQAVQDIQTKMKDVISKFGNSNGMDLSQTPLDLQRTMEELRIVDANSSSDARANDERGLKQPVLMIPSHDDGPVYDRLQGTVSYKRIVKETYKNDPFSGIFLRGTFLGSGTGENGIDVLKLERVTKGDKEFVMARTLTEENCHNNGRVVFRARIGRNQQLPPRYYYHPLLHVAARYQGQMSSNDGSGWVDGAELLQFREPGEDLGGVKAPSLGFVPNIDDGGDMTMSLLHKIDLDDPLEQF